MANFDRYTNYKDNAGVSSVVFGANSTVLEVELNEMQEIQNNAIRDILKNIIGNGITDISKLVYKDGNIEFLDSCGMVADGYYINCSGEKYAINNGTVYMQVWEEVANYNSALSVNGNVNNPNIVANWIKDDRAENETTRRIVVKHRLANSINTGIAINIPIAKISNGIMNVLIKEVNLGKLYNKVDMMDAYDDRDVYGVEVDFETGTITRLAGAVGKSGGTDFDGIRAFDRHRCYVAEREGALLGYINESNGTQTPSYYNFATGLTATAYTAKDGTQIAKGERVNVMVEQNKFYYKVVPVKIDGIYAGEESTKGYHIRRARYYISDTYKPGFKVHPAFIKTSKDGVTFEFDKIYIGAYKSVAYDTNGLANDTTYEDNSENLDYASGGLTSFSGMVPVSGLYHNLSLSGIRKLLTNMDEDGYWRAKDITVMSMDILLFLIEYATFDAQSVLGKGYVNIIGDNRFNLANVTGATNFLASKSSSPLANNGQHSISYRGEEDIYGGLFELIEGYRVDAISKWSNKLYPDGTYPTFDNVNFYQDMGMSGFISAFGYNYDHDWMFIPTRADGDSMVPVGDMVSTNGTYDGDGYVLAYGGNHYSGDSAGICNLKLVWDSSSVDCGCRIVYFPYKTAKNLG